MAEPTPEEIKVIQKFREQVSDVLDNEERREDSFLIRWLRARDMNLHKAGELIRHSLNWRAENDIDNVLERKFDEFYFQHFPYSAEGYDKTGRPVTSISYANGKWDFRKVDEPDRAEGFKAYTAYIFEDIVNKIRMQNAKRKTTGEPPVRQYILLIDYTGFTYSQLINFAAHYPELLYKCIFINCPGFIGTLMSLLKPLLANKTFQKIEYYGYNREEWENVLYEMIDEDQLPPEFGGTEITHL
ncbi:SEC14-like protein 2 [Orchesella cincta]|uniref:SEC14-like protein 2 n=1 Tax=Orchesella cincta TaxID=48709 RepID=A0A1D2NIC8_ORCCI|nr:SEC14-like protein 2 [Orchesella cincta]